MDSVPRTSGIYKITCVPTGKMYIGSAVNIRERWRKHRESLLRNGHDNSYLQRAWNKYGADAFEFSVIELVLAPFLLEREQYWLDKHQSYVRSRGFNISPTAGSTFGLKLTPEQCAAVADRVRGRKHSEETKAKIGAVHKGRVKSPLERQHMSEARIGKPHNLTEDGRARLIAKATGRKHSEETRRKISEANRGKAKPPVSDETRMKMSIAHKNRNMCIRAPATAVDTVERKELGE